MSSRRSAAHSTGPGRTAYFEDDSSVHAHSSEATSSGSLSSVDRDRDSDSWQHFTEDDIQPSESASRPPRDTSSERHSSRHSSRPRHTHSHSHESRPTSSRRKSSARVPTIREEGRQQAHRSHSDHSARDRGERFQYREEGEREYSRHPREHRPRELSSESSSTDSYDSYMSGGGGYSEAPHPHAHHAPPYQHVYQHAPQPPQSNYPPTVMSGHTVYDNYGRSMQPPFDSLIHVPRNDPLDPMGQYAGYPSASNPFSPLPHSANPLSPGASAAGGYFEPLYDPRPASQPQQQQHHYQPQRPQPPRSRPQSYAAPSPYPMETAMAPYYPVPQHGYAGMPAFPPGTDPRLIANYMFEMRLRAEKSSSSSREDLRSRKSKSKSPAAEPAPVAPPVVAPVAPVPPVVVAAAPVVEAPKPEPPIDHAAKLVTLLAEYEEKKRVDAEQKAAASAAAAAVEQAKKDAANMESVKIEKMLAAWRKEQEKREKDKQDAAEAAKSAAEAKAAEEAKLAAAIAAAKEAAETEAAAKAKAAEEEYTKKMAEATAAAEEAAKAKKALEDENAKLQPEADATKKPVSFSDAMGRTFDVPWQFAKTWKGMRALINDAFDPVGGEIGRDVLDGRYDLFGPDEKIIIPKLWDLVIQPGWEIKMTLWPSSKDAVDAVMVDTPGAFMDYTHIVDTSVKKSSKKKTDKPKSSESKKKSHVEVPPPPPMGHMAPPHHAGTYYLPDEVVIPKKAKPKSKPKPSGGLASWITGTRPPKSGKEPEKLSSGPLVHHISNTGSNNNNSHGNDERDYYIIKRSVSGGAGKGATTAHPTAALPSARQSKAGGYHDADRPVEVGCSMM